MEGRNGKSTPRTPSPHFYGVSARGDPTQPVRTFDRTVLEGGTPDTVGGREAWDLRVPETLPVGTGSQKARATKGS